jgi:hypothetical protein
VLAVTPLRQKLNTALHATDLKPTAPSNFTNKAMVRLGRYPYRFSLPVPATLSLKKFPQSPYEKTVASAMLSPLL